MVDMCVRHLRGSEARSRKTKKMEAYIYIVDVVLSLLIRKNRSLAISEWIATSKRVGFSSLELLCCSSYNISTLIRPSHLKYPSIQRSSALASLDVVPGGSRLSRQRVHTHTHCALLDIVGDSEERKERESLLIGKLTAVQ